jgi:hypothetical protein
MSGNYFHLFPKYTDEQLLELTSQWVLLSLC